MWWLSLMTERTKRSDVEEQIALLRAQLIRMGLLNERQAWHLQAGSRTYGQPWELRDATTMMGLPWLSYGHLGNSAADVVERLQTIRRVFDWLEAEDLLGPMEED